MNEHHEGPGPGPGLSIADHVIRAAVESGEGIRVGGAADYLRLMEHRLANLNACCWPSRMHMRLARAVHRSMLRMITRLDRLDLLHPVGWLRRRVIWIQARFVLFALLAFCVSKMLPNCRCSKEEDHEGKEAT